LDCVLARLLGYLRRHHIALIALFVALGGTSYAAIKLPANSVGSKQLRRGAVTPSKISARTARLLRGRRGPAGPHGPQGAVGKTGARGKTGSRGPRGYRGPAGVAGPAGTTGAAGAAAASMLVGSWIPESTSGTDLAPPLGSREDAPSVANGATDADVAALSAAADAVGRELAVGVKTAPGTGRSWAVTLRVNGADTPLTCTIAGDATSCDSGAATVAIAKKSTMSFKIEPSGTPATTPIYFGWRLTSGS
jgi:Collagen triple helix repeat (20 copies)